VPLAVRVETFARRARDGFPQDHASSQHEAQEPGLGRTSQL
jgi:hypothetical protein